MLGNDVANARISVHTLEIDFDRRLHGFSSGVTRASVAAWAVLALNFRKSGALTCVNGRGG